MRKSHTNSPPRNWLMGAHQIPSDFHSYAKGKTSFTSQQNIFCWAHQKNNIVVPRMLLLLLLLIQEAPSNSKDVSYSYYIMIFRPIIVNTTRQTGFPLRFFLGWQQNVKINKGSFYLFSVFEIIITTNTRIVRELIWSVHNECIIRCLVQLNSCTRNNRFVIKRVWKRRERERDSAIDDALHYTVFLIELSINI